MVKEVKSIPGDKRHEDLKRRIARGEQTLNKLSLYREKDRGEAESLRAQITKWREELRRVISEQKNKD